MRARGLGSCSAAWDMTRKSDEQGVRGKNWLVGCVEGIGHSCDSFTTFIVMVRRWELEAVHTSSGADLRWWSVSDG